MELDDVVATDTELRIRVKTRGTTKLRVLFIGDGGRVLQEQSGPDATYRFTGSERYVRARVVDSNGRTAWVQPVFVRRSLPGAQ